MNPKLTKANLSSAVENACDLPKDFAGRAIDTSLDSVAHALSIRCVRNLNTTAVKTVLSSPTHAFVQGDDVRITGFGAFNTRSLPQQWAHSPQTEQPLTVPQSRVVRFVPGNMLRTAVRQR